MSKHADNSFRPCIEQLEDRTAPSVTTVADSAIFLHDRTFVSTDSVLANDSSSNNETLTASLLRAPLHSYVVLNADGSYLITPNAGFVGTDYLVYQAADSTDSAAGMLTWTVTNTAPTAIDANYSGVHDQIIHNINLAPLCSDADGDTLQISIVSSTSHGQLTQNADGTWDYVPDVNWAGSDSFTIKANDGITDSNVALVSFLVTNEAPVFTAPTVPATPSTPARYVRNLGYAATAWTYVNGGSIRATDADGDPLTYQITAGDPDGFFRYRADGYLWTVSDLPANDTLQYVLTLTASDGVITTTAQVEINLRTQVVVTGDTQGTEAGDAIRLEFIRSAHDLSQALYVTVEIAWTATGDGIIAAQPSDLQNNGAPLPGPGTQQMTVTIPAYATAVVLPDLVPAARADRNGRREFTVTVLPEADYIVPDYTVNMALPYGFRGAKKVDCTILDGITLFAQRPGDDNDIHFNDVKQGLVGDCYLMAAMAEVARRNPEFIRSMFCEDGGLSVTLYDGVGSAPVQVPIPWSLDLGIAQANLSDDFDANNNSEVWTLMLERAYREHFGWDALNGGGTARLAWERLTGQAAATLYTDDFTSDSLRTRIQADWNAGKKICFGTWGSDKKDSWSYTPPGTTDAIIISSNHVYAMTAIDGDNGVKIYNPNGQQGEFTLGWADIKSFVGDVDVQ